MPSEEQTSIVFTISVSRLDWDAGFGGWRCSALKIPGARLEEIYVAGTRVDDGSYVARPEIAMVRWPHPPPPKQAILSIRLTEELSPKRLTLRWQKLAIILPLIAALLVAYITHYFSCSPSPPPPASKESIVFTLSTPVSGDCGRVTVNSFAGISPGAHEKITQLLWDWGDGTAVDSSLPATHRYQRNGKYSVKVTAYAGNDMIGGQNLLVNITTADQPTCQ